MHRNKLTKSNSFFRKNNFIKIGDKTIYFNQIGCHNVLKKLFPQEEILIKTGCSINTKTSKPFFNIKIQTRNKVNINSGDILVIRITKGKKCYELISKVYPWGKVHVPSKVISQLSINHHENISIEIIKKPEESTLVGTTIRKLFENNINTTIIQRAHNIITVYKAGSMPITLPNRITLTPTLVEVFYLIHGDGHYKTKFFFVNNNPELHQLVINIFDEQLKIPKNIWRGRINLNYSHEEAFASNYWLKVLPNRSQFYPSISKTKFNTSRQGNLRIAIDYHIIAELFRTIFAFMKENLKNKLYLHALNGLLAAEGGAQIGQKGLHRITLSYSKEEKELFIEILQKCEMVHLFKVQDRKNSGTLIVEKWENLHHFFERFFCSNVIPFQSHSKRKERALKGMTDHSFTNTMEKYLSVLVQKENFTVKQLSRILQIREDSCLSTIRKKQYSKFIIVKGEGINRKPFIISASSQGKDLLSLISMIKSKVKS